MNAAIRVEYGAVHRDGTVVLEPAGFTFPVGATVGLVGANGAGKSTLMMGAADVLEQPHAVRARLPDGGQPRIRYLPQQAAFPGWATGAEVARAYGCDPDTLAAAYPQFDPVRLLTPRTATLSGGQRQLLALLLTLAADADLYLLDEPLAALDLLRRRQLFDLLHARRARGDSVTLVSSHVAADLYEVCDWFLVLRNGACVFQGSREEMMQGAAAATVSGDERRTFEDRILELIA